MNDDYNDDCNGDNDDYNDDCNGGNEDYNDDCNGDIDECKLPLKHSFSQ